MIQFSPGEILTASKLNELVQSTLNLLTEELLNKINDSITLEDISELIQTINSLKTRVEELELVNLQISDMLDLLYAENLILILNGSNEGVATNKTTEELINELNYGNS